MAAESGWNLCQKFGELRWQLEVLFSRLIVVEELLLDGRSSGNAGRSASCSGCGGCSGTGGGGQARSQVDGPESNAVAAPEEGQSGAEGKSREGKEGGQSRAEAESG